MTNGETLTNDFSVSPRRAAERYFSTRESLHFASRRSECNLRGQFASGRRSGFSRVELLAILLIVAMTAGLLVPAAIRNRRQANAGKCVFYQKHLMQACLDYARDHGGVLPATGWAAQIGTNWLYGPRGSSGRDVAAGELWPYLGNNGCYRCPDDVGPWSPRGAAQELSSYAMNAALTVPGGVRLDQLKPDDIVLFERVDGLADPAAATWAASSPAAGFATRHARGHGCAVSMMDGHSDLLMELELQDLARRAPSSIWCNPTRPDGGLTEFGQGRAPSSLK